MYNPLVHSQMEEKKETTDNKVTPFWLQYGDLYLNPVFFKRGLLVVSPKPEAKDASPETESFLINNREFFFIQGKKEINLYQAPIPVQ